MPDVLIIDDEWDVRACLAEALSSDGFTVLEARDGQEALRLLERARPALILLDLMMPVMSGWEFRERQRRRPELAGIPVIVMTAYGDPGVQGDRMLPKPFDPEMLLRAVHDVTRPRALHDGRDHPP